jgi:branched-chain amino acid transport system substrate-binding protein
LAQTKLLGMLIIGLIIGVAVGYGAFAGTAPSAPTQVAPQQQAKIPSEIPIGVLITLTGELSDLGPLYRTTALIAQDDVNAYLKDAGLNYTVKVYLEDSATTGEGALAATQALAAKGIQVIITYLSVDIRSTLTYVNDHHIVEISYASTAPELAIPNDYVFRLVPTDLHQSKAIARMMWTAGVRNAAVVYRGDAWGDGLFGAFNTEWTALGGKLDSVRFDPSAKDLSAEALKLSDIVKGFGISNSTGVLHLTFDEDGIALLTAIKDNTALTSVRWFGSDGDVGSPRIRDVYGDLVHKIWMPSTIYSVPNAPNQASYLQRWRTATGETLPSSYQYALYDAVFLTTLSTLQAGVYDGAAIQKVFPQVADHYYGLTGWAILDDAGDRAYAPYEIQAILPTAGVSGVTPQTKPLDWVIVGYYSEETDLVTWVPPQVP